MNRLTTDNMDFESMFCAECPYYGEPNGCNNQTECKAYSFFTAAANRLKEYEDAEEQGLIVKLPCKVGDIVYTISENKIFACEVFKIKFEAELEHGGTTFIREKVICWSGETPFSFDFCDFGKTVFLTREAAEESENI